MKIEEKKEEIKFEIKNLSKQKKQKNSASLPAKAIPVPI